VTGIANGALFEQKTYSLKIQLLVNESQHFTLFGDKYMASVSGNYKNAEEMAEFVSNVANAVVGAPTLSFVEGERGLIEGVASATGTAEKN